MTKDDRRLLKYGLLTAALVMAALWPIYASGVKVPKVILEAILFVMALVIFRLSKRAASSKIN